LYETPGYLSDVRISSDGQHIAFTEHPEKGDDRGGVGIVDLKGNHKLLTPQYPALEGLAWTAGDKTIAFGESTQSGLQHVDEVALDGDIRPGPPEVGNAVILDIAPDGRRLVMRADLFDRLWVKRATNSAPRDLSWLDVTFFPILSGDGSLLIFGDGSGEAGENYAVMARHTDGSPAVKLGEGADYALSRDKQWVLSSIPSVPVKLMMLPTGAGTARRIDNGEFLGVVSASFLGDGSRIVVCGNEPKHAVRCYVRALEGGKFRPVTSEGVSGAVMAPDGENLVVRIADGYRQFSIRDGTSHQVPGVTSTDQVLRYSPDGNFLWTRNPRVQPVHVEQIDTRTGARSPLIPDFARNRSGVISIGYVALADDPHTYAFIEREAASYLFELRGMKQ
jgi:hypothetical protein